MYDPKLEALLQEAKTLAAYGHDNRYIELQMAEKGVQDETIDAVISELNKFRKSMKRSAGKRMLIYGFSLSAAAIVMGWFGSGEHGNYVITYVPYGLAVSGVLVCAKGVMGVLGW